MANPFDPVPASSEAPAAGAPAAPVLTDEEKAAAAAEKAVADDNAKRVEEARKIAEAQAAKEKSAAETEKSKQKSAHIVTVTGGVSKLGIANSCGNDGVPIPRDGPLTIALVKTSNPTPGLHPGTEANCVARLPDKSEIGDLVEVYCVPGQNGPAAFVHPPTKEAIGLLPVSTGDNPGTGIGVAPGSGTAFRKTSATLWQVLGG
jgi:hypothetical protein